MVLKIAYWDFRGLGAPLRMMCAFAGEPYENIMYSQFSVYAQDRNKLKTSNPLVNLPYIQDDDKVIAQSNACFLYLGKKFGLDEQDDETLVKLWQTTMQVTDLREDLVRMLYPGYKVSRTQEEFDANLEKYFEKDLKIHYEKFEEWLICNRTRFLCGDSPASPDFHLFEMLDQHELMSKQFKQDSVVKAFPRLAKFYDDFRNLPQLQEYFDSELHKLPCNTALLKAYFV